MARRSLPRSMAGTAVGLVLCAVAGLGFGVRLPAEANVKTPSVGLVTLVQRLERQVQELQLELRSLRGSVLHYETYGIGLRAGNHPDKAEKEKEGYVYIPTGKLKHFTDFHLGTLDVKKGRIEWFRPPGSQTDHVYVSKESSIVAVWLTSPGGTHAVSQFEYLTPLVHNGNEIWLQAMLVNDERAITGQSIHVLYRLPSEEQSKRAQDAVRP